MPSPEFRIIFMGTPEFASASLKALLDAGFNVVAIVTAPDKPAGRGQKLQESHVKQFAKNFQIPILQPEKLKNPDFIEKLQSFRADLQVVVAFRMLPEAVWSMPRLGTINLHASLLPQYRGAAPINWAIINGDKETGATTFFIEKEIDTGKIIFTTKIAIDDNDNAGILHDKLMETGAQLLVKTVSAIESGKYPQIEQTQSSLAGTSLHNAPKIFKETCKIDWSNDIATTYNFIRGLSPYPTAWAMLQHKETQETSTVKIFETEKELTQHQIQPGIILTDEKTFLKIATNGGYLHLKTLQLEGKKRLAIDEFLRGFKGVGGYRFI